MKTTAAALVRHALEQIGVRYTFGIPGVHNIELYDELLGSKSIQPVLVTHEGGGAFMADAISRATDSIGVLAIVPAAGITHAMRGVGEAFLDGVPMRGISGGVRTDRVTYYEPGETIEVRWDEYVDHPGHYRNAFDPDGDDDFVDPATMIEVDSEIPISFLGNTGGRLPRVALR